MTVATYRAGPGELDAELRAAFALFRDQRAVTGVIVLAVAVRPRLELVDLVVSQIATVASLERLVLVHPSPSVGFFASSIGLRAGRVRVTSAPVIEATVASPVASTQRPSSRIELIEIAAGQDLGMAIAARLVGVRERGVSGIALVLPADHRPPRQLVETLCPVLEANRDITTLALIHPSPSLGFLASAIGLRLPRLRVRAFRDARELALLGTTLPPQSA